MANRRDFFYLQKVTEGELDGAFNELEQADRDMAVDFGFFGILSNLAVTQNGGGNLTVDVSGLGTAYDQTGQRIYVPSLQNVNCAVDFNSVTTTVATPGNSKIVSLFIQFDRALSDPRVDGNSLTVYFVRTETFKFKVVQGAEAASPSAPSLLSDGVLLADITRSFGVTTITTPNIDLAARRQDSIFVDDSPFSLREGTPADAIRAFVLRYNQHVNGTADGHIGAAIAYGGGANWADGSANGAATVEVTLDSIFTSLGGATGANKIGATITSLWKDGSGISGNTIDAALEEIVSDLAGAVGGFGGAAKVGLTSASTATWFDASNPSTGNAADTVGHFLNRAIGDLGGNSGAARIGTAARTTWLGGRTNPASVSVFAAIDKIITDLNAATGADDGAERIGAAAGPTSLSAGSVRSQLDDLDTNWGKLSRANTFSGVQSFSAGIILTTGGFGVRHRPLTLNNADQTIDETHDLFEVPAITADRTYSLDTASAPPDGCIAWVIREAVDETNDVFVKNGVAGSQIHQIPDGQLGSAMFFSVSGSWKRGIWYSYTP